MTAIFIIGGILIVFGIILGISNSKKASNFYSENGIKPEELINSGKYTCGHPDIDKPIDKTSLLIKENKILILGLNESLIPFFTNDIPITQIKNIVIEDASSIQKRVTVGRMLAVGLFAFAWKKKKVEEMSYLIVEWNDGRFDHETIFEFSGKGSVENSNTARNKLIKAVR